MVLDIALGIIGAKLIWMGICGVVVLVVAGFSVVGEMIEKRGK